MPKNVKKVMRPRSKVIFALSGSGKSQEKVMVISRSDMFSLGLWHGLKTNDVEKHLNLISKKHRFLARSKVEDNPRWKQIIPYLVFESGGKYFLVQRRGDHTDKRLANKFSIGIGGHINRKDVVNSASKSIMDWARREFKEEVEYHGEYKAAFLGLINDDSNDVGLVHVGLVIRIGGDSNNIRIRDEHKVGRLEPLSMIGRHYRLMETWSQIVYDFLKENQMREKQKVNVSKSGRVSVKNIFGILPDWAIGELIDKKVIQISPLDKTWRKNIDQVSMDFHLGTSIKLFRTGAYRFIDTRRGLPSDAMEEVKLSDGSPFILEPGAFAIATTREVLKLPDDVLGRLEGKSSLARLGILVHSTAARFDPGWNGAPVLELGNLGPKPAILYAGMPICAFTFEKLAAPVRMRYEGSRSDRYSGSRIPVASRIEKHVAAGISRQGKKKRIL